MRIIGQANSKMFTVNKDTKLTKLNTEKKLQRKMVVQKTDGLYAAEHSHFKEANKGQVANANASQSSELARAQS